MADHQEKGHAKSSTSQTSQQRYRQSHKRYKRYRQAHKRYKRYRQAHKRHKHKSTVNAVNAAHLDGRPGAAPGREIPGMSALMSSAHCTCRKSHVSMIVDIGTPRFSPSLSWLLTSVICCVWGGAQGVNTAH